MDGGPAPGPAAPGPPAPPAAPPSEPERRKKRRQTINMSVLTQKRRPNVPHEEEFLRAVEAGDYPTVRRMLRTHPTLDVNCTDLLGRTPLRIAVQNENEEIVEILLDRAGTRNMYESLLLAISLDAEQIALSILRHPMYAKLEQQTRLYSNDSIFLSSSNEDSLFAAETTPLILAAQKNRYEVLSLLLKRGAKIEEPHEMSCDCARCETNSHNDELRYAKSRLNAYKGLASEAYICLASLDPVLTAFNLRRKLGRVAANEKHYRDEYNELRDKLGQFVVKLLDCVRGNEELDVLLSTENEDEGEQLGRLHLALRYNEKKFVAHSSCQKKLSTIWYGKAQKHFHRWPSWAYPIFVVSTGLTFPFLSIAYLCAPSSRVASFLKIPFIKFIGQSTSFFFFLFLICIFSLSEKPSTNVYEIANDFKWTEAYKATLEKNLTEAGYGWSEHHREYMPPNIQMVLNVFVIGLVWQECKQLYGSSLKEYFSSLFNVMDSISLCLYLASFSLRYVSTYKTYMSRQYFRNHDNVQAIIRGDPEAMHQLYWVYADRYYWDTLDPIVVAEGLFAVANVVSFTRLFYLLAANEQLGPLQISLRRMIGDISRFMAILFIIFMAFMVGLNNLYWYYEPSVRGKVELEVHEQFVTEAESAFGTVEKTFTTMFWAMFGMGEHTVVTLGDGYSGGYTERIGYVVFGAYNIAIVIILLNMLIAMMSRSFEAIADEEDVEWKFARAQLYMDFIQEGSTLPVPFNIIPSPKTIVKFCSSLSQRYSKQEDPSDDEGSTEEMNNLRHLQDETDTKGEITPIVATLKSSSKAGSVSSRSSAGHSKIKKEEGMGGTAVKKIQKLFKSKDEKPQAAKPSFETVIKRVVKRYIFESKQVDTSPLEGDIDELKQDLSGVRFELNNLLSTNQKKIVSSIHLLNTKLDILTAKLNSQNVMMNVPMEPQKPSSVFTRLHNQLQDEKKIGKYVKGFRRPPRGRSHSESQSQGPADNQSQQSEGDSQTSNAKHGRSQFKTLFGRLASKRGDGSLDLAENTSNKTTHERPTSSMHQRINPKSVNQVKVKNTNQSILHCERNLRGNEESQNGHSDFQPRGQHGNQGQGPLRGHEGDLETKSNKDKVQSQNQPSYSNQRTHEENLAPHDPQRNAHKGIVSNKRQKARHDPLGDLPPGSEHEHSELREKDSNGSIEVGVDSRNIRLLESRNPPGTSRDSREVHHHHDEHSDGEYDHDHEDSSATEDGCSNTVYEDEEEESTEEDEAHRDFEYNEREEQEEGSEGEEGEESQGYYRYHGGREPWLQEDSSGEMEEDNQSSHSYSVQNEREAGRGEGDECSEEDWEEGEGEEEEWEEEADRDYGNPFSPAISDQDGLLEDQAGVDRLHYTSYDNRAYSTEGDTSYTDGQSEQGSYNKTYPSVSFQSQSHPKKRPPKAKRPARRPDLRPSSLHLTMENDQEIDC